MIAAGALARGGPVEVRLTDHATQRYRERVKPHLTSEQAGAELAALVALCPIREGVPAWLSGGQQSMFHLDLGTVMLAIDPDPRDESRLMARTVLAVGCFSRRRGRKPARTSRNEASSRGPRSRAGT
jgi:hypothetical protein